MRISIIIYANVIKLIFITYNRIEKNQIFSKTLLFENLVQKTTCDKILPFVTCKIEILNFHSKL